MKKKILHLKAINLNARPSILKKKKYPNVLYAECEVTNLH